LLIRHRSYLAIALHLVWSTRDRSPLISSQIEPRLYDYLVAIAVSPSHRKRIIAYIHNQKQHHADGTTLELLERDYETYDTDEEDSSEGRAAAGA
jgi:hypothetical protein